MKNIDKILIDGVEHTVVCIENLYFFCSEVFSPAEYRTIDDIMCILQVERTTHKLSKFCLPDEKTGSELLRIINCIEDNFKALGVPIKIVLTIPQFNKFLQ